VLEVGCGAGNSVYPLVEENPRAYVHACDFSPRAVEIVRQHPRYAAERHRVNAFVADITDPASLPGDSVPPGTVDFVMCVFVLSAIAPARMAAALANMRACLRPGSGAVAFRDYASGDLAEMRLSGAGRGHRRQRLGERNYVRGDGTCSYFFEEPEVLELFRAAGFRCRSLTTHERFIDNRSRQVRMLRRWVQGVFSLDPATERVPYEPSFRGAGNVSVPGAGDGGARDAALASAGVLRLGGGGEGAAWDYDSVMQGRKRRGGAAPPGGGGARRALAPARAPPGGAADPGRAAARARELAERGLAALERTGVLLSVVEWAWGGGEGGGEGGGAGGLARWLSPLLEAWGRGRPGGLRVGVVVEGRGGGPSLGDALARARDGEGRGGAAFDVVAVVGDASAAAAEAACGLLRPGCASRCVWACGPGRDAGLRRRAGGGAGVKPVAPTGREAAALAAAGAPGVVLLQPVVAGGWGFAA